MSLRCAIVDDEPISIEVLENQLLRIPNIQVLAKFNDALSVIDFLSCNEVDFLFLDIEMPQITGIELLKSLTNPPLVIIISANKNYALDGYELNVVDYILKPISFTRLVKAIGKVTETLVTRKTLSSAQDISYIFVKENKRMVRINISDILFVEGMKDYVKIVTKDKAVISKYNLSDIEKLLISKDFFRAHKSYIVSLEHVDAYSCSFIEIGKHNIPIGRYHKEGVLKRLGEINTIEE